MNMKIVLGLLIALIVIGCGPTLSDYTPRWVDYEEWGKLKLGMTLQETLDLMGEPYLPLRGEFQGTNKVFYVSYFIKPKLYHNVRSSGSIFADPTVATKPTKPLKFDTTNVWEDIPRILICAFENDHLVRFHLVTSTGEVTDSTYIYSKVQ